LPVRELRGSDASTLAYTALPFRGVAQAASSSMRSTQPGLLRRIAADVERATRRREEGGGPGATTATTLAYGDGWVVDDVVCTSGPGDRPFEERHESVSVAVVLAGTFQYRTGNVRELMTPGSFLLGNAGECFECGHQHAAGDRCVAFHFTPELFERMAFDAVGRRGSHRFRVGRLPPLRDLSRVSCHAVVGLLEAPRAAWDEVAIDVAAVAVQLASRVGGGSAAPRGAEDRVSAAVRAIERDPVAPHTLPALAADAGLSPYHFLRTFRAVAGVTPHQFILRMRLREAAARLATDGAKVIEVALGAGFNDLSNFNHAFRAEFGIAPRAHRMRHRRRSVVV
jgi:AraC family transcriptional regulator